ncbi:DUF6574 domain-containing protein [Lactiplantibacillus dongliensis]|uniref:DUF6574 domain-containing protein n=1 Tax=Lactiplantibacillus dongliensis TaxID=2559919 RepID=A0ABW1R617_9LACO|nr:zinc ribbon domain-containing protein [Lactiplantibacillus dongliensis]
MQNYCPNCGEAVDGDTRFCTHCGYDLQQATAESATNTMTNTTQTTTDQPNPAAAPTNDRVAQLQNYSKNYFSWFVESIKHPNTEAPAEKYFGIISMVLSALLLTFAIVAAINRFIKQVNESTASSMVTLKNLSFGLDTKLFIVVVIGVLFYILIGFGASALGDKNGAVNFFDYLNRFGHLTNVGLILNIVLIFSVYTITFNVDSPLTFIKQLAFALVVIAAISMVWQVGYIMAINNSINEKRFDKFYIILIALVVLSLAFYIFARIESENLVLDFAQEFSQNSSLGDLFSNF